MKNLEYVIGIIGTILKIVSIVLFTVLIFLTIFQVLSRYFFSAPISFSEEMGRFLFIWISFLGAAIVMKDDEHIRLDILKEKLSHNGWVLLQIFVFSLITVFSFVIFLNGIKLIGATSRQVAPVTRIPMSYIYIVIPLSFFTMFLFSSLHIIKSIFSIRRDSV